MYTVIDGLPTFLPTASPTKKPEQSQPEVHKKCTSDQQFRAKTPRLEVHKNRVSDQTQWSEMTKTPGHHCSLKMWQIMIWHLDLEQSGAWT